MTWAGGSPRANRSSASRRRPGHAYEPGSSRACASRAVRSRCARSAWRRVAVRHPAASHTAVRLTTRSRPARRRTKSSARCAAHSQTRTPKPNRTAARSPDPGPMQIAHGGTLPSPRAL